eukprot:3848808-Pyramimonas_sp.AAC.1
MMRVRSGDVELVAILATAARWDGARRWHGPLPAPLGVIIGTFGAECVAQGMRVTGSMALIIAGCQGETRETYEGSCAPGKCVREPWKRAWGIPGGALNTRKSETYIGG